MEKRTNQSKKTSSPPLTTNQKVSHKKMISAEGWKRAITKRRKRQT